METQLLRQLKEDKGVALVEFYATWCPHCARMKPVVEDLRTLFDGIASVYQFDIDENNEFASELGVRGLPTFIIFSGGNEVWRCEGEVDGNVLAGKVQEYAGD